MVLPCCCFLIFFFFFFLFLSFFFVLVNEKQARDKEAGEVLSMYCTGCGGFHEVKLLKVVDLVHGGPMDMMECHKVTYLQGNARRVD